MAQNNGTAKSRFATLDFYQVLLAILMLFVSFYPLDPVETKIQIIGALIVVSLLMMARTAGNAMNCQRFLVIAGMISSLILYIAISRPLFPVLNDYSANKFLFTYYSLGVFGIVLPWLLYRGRGAADVVVVLLSLSFVLGLVSFFPTIESDNLRYSVIGLSPTLMAKLTCIISLIFIVYPSKDRARFALAGAAFLFGIFATINTGSRGSLVALTVVYIIFSVSRGGVGPLLKSVFGLFAIGLFVYVGLQFAPAEIQERFTWEAVSVEENSDEGDRLYLWNIAVEGIRAKVFGHGLGSFSYSSFIAVPHNIALESMYELGLIFSAIFLFYVFAPVFRMKEMLSREEWQVHFVYVAYLYNLALSLFGGEMSLSNTLLYFTCSFIWLLKRDPKNGKASVGIWVGKRDGLAAVADGR